MKSVAVSVAALFLMVPVAQSDHVQDEGGQNALFDHRGGNEWWVEVDVDDSLSADDVSGVDARDTDGRWVALEKKSWGVWAASFHIEPGHEVQFRAHYAPTDTVIESCWFSHPEGKEDCTTTDPRLAGATLIDFEGYERSSDVVVLDDGSAVVVGGGFVARYDADAQAIWSRQIPANVQAAATHDGDIFLAGGVQRSDGAGNNWQPGPSGDEDVWVARWTADGTTLWHTSFGGTDRDVAHGIGVAPSGVVVVGGLTNSCDFPAYGPAADQERECSTLDGFVTRLTSHGNGAVYSRELDVGGGAYVRDLTVTEDDMTHLVGSTWYDEQQPTTPDARQPESGGRGDGLYMVLDGFGEIQYATLMGGEQQDGLLGVAKDGASAWVTGYSGSAGYPTTPDGLQPEHGGGMECGYVTEHGPSPTIEDVPCSDIVITRFDADHSIGYSTFYGGIYPEAAQSIAIGEDETVHVAGEPRREQGYPTSEEPIGPVGGYSDMFLLSLAAGGSEVDHAVRLGGSDADYDVAIAVGPAGHVWLAGSTGSWDIPTTPGAEQRHHGQGFDAYLARFDDAAAAPAPFTFDHKGGNEWWAQVRVTGEVPSRVQAKDTGGNWQELTLRDWGDWAGSFHIEPGHDTRFRAMADGTWHRSCWFTHPGGKAPDGGGTCTGPDGAGAVDGGAGDLDASFSTPGGNEWWVEVSVDANEPLAGVAARDDGGTWIALEKKDWGAWAKSFHVEDGSLVEFRATSADGDSEISDSYRWPEGTKE